ncbi:MAG: GFA family protein [Sphingobium sp.]
MNQSEVRSGGCLCGKIRYTVPSQPAGVIVCHCGDCQKQAGSAFSLIAVYPQPTVAIKGECAVFEIMGASGKPVARHFCGSCGSPIYSETQGGREAGLAFIKAGTLDDVSDLAPSAHFWVRSKQPWVQLPEGAVAIDKQ